MTRLSSQVIGSIDWSLVDTMSGTGEQLAAAIRSFVDCEDANRMRDLWRGLEGVAFAQSTIVGAAEPLVDVLMASLADERPSFVYSWILEALRFVLEAGSPEDPELSGRCHERAQRGVWSLARTLTRLDPADRIVALQLIESLDPLVHSWVQSDD
jgi:hypothetical protein